MGLFKALYYWVNTGQFGLAHYVAGGELEKMSAVSHCSGHKGIWQVLRFNSKKWYISFFWNIAFFVFNIPLESMAAWVLSLKRNSYLRYFPPFHSNHLPLPFAFQKPREAGWKLFKVNFIFPLGCRTQNTWSVSPANANNGQIFSWWDPERIPCSCCLENAAEPKLWFKVKRQVVKYSGWVT